MQDRERKLANLNNICTVFWLLLDGFWLMEWPFLTYLCSAIATIINFALFAYLERGRTYFLMYAAETAWLFLNIFWAVGDLEQIAWCVTAAKICFGVSVAFVAGAFLAGLRTKFFVELLFRRFRQNRTTPRG